MRYLLYLPGILLILVPLMLIEWNNRAQAETQRRKEAERAAAEEQREMQAAARKAAQEAKAAERERRQAEREQVRAAKEAERQRKQDAAHALKVARAAELAELAERELAARRAAMALDAGKAEPTTEEHSEPEHDAEPTRPDTEPTRPDSLLSRLGVKGNNAFKGQVVAFTGKLPGMTRAQAIQAVQDNGGRAYTKMPAGTTLLVVGDKPGMCKMDKADAWIGQVRKITAAQFFEMLSEPLTVEPEELEAAFAIAVAPLPKAGATSPGESFGFQPGAAAASA